MSDPRSDLPLFPDAPAERPRSERHQSERHQSERPSEPAEEPEAREVLPPLALEEPTRKPTPERLPLDAPDPVPVPEPTPTSASLGSRWKAGLFDLLVHAVLGLFLLAGSWLLGARVGGSENLGVATFLVVFSFLYTAIPLAFWGRTPGMAWANLVAATGEEGGLTFGQTALRWLGGLLTVVLLGLPSLLVLAGGRSLTDRLSGSRTWRSAGARP